MTRNITLQQNFTRKESSVLDVLWRSEKPLSASEIANGGGEELSIYTVHNMLGGLLKRELICIADIVYSGTVLCRRFETTSLFTQYSIDRFVEQYYLLAQKIDPAVLFAALLDIAEPGVIAAYDELVARKKRGFEKG